MTTEAKEHPSAYEISEMSQSQLLRLAISDLKSIKKNGVVRNGKAYSVKEEGSNWVVIDFEKEECAVCLAGAVLVGIGHFGSPGTHSYCATKWAWEINDLRMGIYKNANSDYSFYGSNLLFKPVWMAYRRAKKQMASIARYEEFAEFLESKGL